MPLGKALKLTFSYTVFHNLSCEPQSEPEENRCAFVATVLSVQESELENWISVFQLTVCSTLRKTAGL